MKQRFSSIHSRSGFTIVELFIVIVIVSLLSLLVVVGYRGIQSQARAVTAASLLNQAAKKLALSKLGSAVREYPATLASIGISDANGSVFQYSYDNVAIPHTYCVTVSVDNSVSYWISNTSQKPTLGACPGHTDAGAAANGGVVTTLAGAASSGYADGTGAAARFWYPLGIAVDSSGTIYVGDSSNNRVRKITSAGVVTTLAGSGTATFADGTGTAASFRGPGGVAVDSSGMVYVADCDNNRVRKITSAGVVTTLAGSGSAAYADGTGTAARFNCPNSVAVDASGTVYVSDISNQRIRKITSAGVVTTLAGSGTAAYADGTGTAASFNAPLGVTVDASGTLYVADTSNQRIRKISPAGAVTTLAGSGSNAFADGTGTAASFSGARATAVDASGTLYVADMNNHRIRKIK